MKIFGSLTDCGCSCVPADKSSGCEPKDIPKYPASDPCCGEDKEDCCKEEEEPAKQSLWSRYLERLKKITGNQPPKCH